MAGTEQKAEFDENFNLNEEGVFNLFMINHYGKQKRNMMRGRNAEAGTGTGAEAEVEENNENNSDPSIYGSPVENQFLQHALLETYFKKGKGNYPVNVLIIFKTLLESVIFEDNSAQIQQIKQFLIPLLEEAKNIYIGSLTYGIRYAEPEIKKILNSKGHILLSGGYDGKPLGHSIMFYIIKKPDNYEMLVVNSEKNCFLREENEENVNEKFSIIPIVTKINNINEPQLNDFIYLYLKGTISRGRQKINSVFVDFKYSFGNFFNERNEDFRDNDIDHNENIIEKIGGWISSQNEKNQKNLSDSYNKLIKEYNDYKKKYDYYGKIGIGFYNKFGGKQEENIDKYYHNYLCNILFKDNKKEYLYKDFKQIINSCSYFAVYYFIKYIFLHISGNNILFDQFENKYKHLLIHFIIFFGKTPEIWNRTNDKSKKIFVECLYLLNKDKEYEKGYNEQMKELYFSNLNNPFSCLLKNKEKPIKNEEPQDIDVYFEKINEVKNKLLREKKIYLSDLIFLFNVDIKDKNIFFYKYCMYNFFINVLKPIHQNFMGMEEFKYNFYKDENEEPIGIDIFKRTHYSHYFCDPNSYGPGDKDKGLRMFNSCLFLLIVNAENSKMILKQNYENLDSMFTQDETGTEKKKLYYNLKDSITTYALCTAEQKYANIGIRVFEVYNTFCNFFNFKYEFILDNIFRWNILVFKDFTHYQIEIPVDGTNIFCLLEVFKYQNLRYRVDINQIGLNYLYKNIKENILELFNKTDYKYTEYNLCLKKLISNINDDSEIGEHLSFFKSKNINDAFYRYLTNYFLYKINNNLFDRRHFDDLTFFKENSYDNENKPIIINESRQNFVELLENFECFVKKKNKIVSNINFYPNIDINNTNNNFNDIIKKLDINNFIKYNTQLIEGMKEERKDKYNNFINFLNYIYLIQNEEENMEILKKIRDSTVNLFLDNNIIEILNQKKINVINLILRQYYDYDEKDMDKTGELALLKESLKSGELNSKYFKKNYNMIAIESLNIPKGLKNSLKLNGILVLYQSKLNNKFYFININYLEEKSDESELIEIKIENIVDIDYIKNNNNQILISNNLSIFRFLDDDPTIKKIKYTNIDYLIWKDIDFNINNGNGKICIQSYDVPNIIIEIYLNNKIIINKKLIDTNSNKRYDIIDELDFYKNNSLLSSWMFGMMNMLLIIEENNIKKEYKFLFWLNKDTIINLNDIINKIAFTGDSHENKLEKYFEIDNKNFYTNFKIIDLHYSYLYPIISDISSLSLFVLTLGLNMNYVQFNYFYESFKNLFFNKYINLSDYEKEEKEKSNSFTIKDIQIFDLVKYSIFGGETLLNIPSWQIIENNNRSFSLKNMNMENIRLKNYQVSNNQNINELYQIFINFFEPIKRIGIEEKINLKTNVGTMEQFLETVKFFCEKNSLNSLMGENKNLVKFLKNNNNRQIKAKLDDFNLMYSNYQKNILWNNFKNNIKPFKKNININHKTYEISKKIGDIISLNELLLLNHNDLYNMIFLRTIQDIYLEMKKMIIKRGNGTKNLINLKNCLILGELYKPIDPEIILSTNSMINYEAGTTSSPKEIYEQIFELEFGSYIRRQQKEFIDLIYDNIAQNNYETAYQLLMGRGKTAVITPLIILKENLDKQRKEFTVCLPEHLIDSSFDILIKFQKNLNLDLEILKIKNQITPNFNKRNHINIVSDTVFKTSVLTEITGRENNLNARQENAGVGANKNINLNLIYNKDRFTIIDEIDSIIDPLKSNLNIVKSKGSRLPYDVLLFEIFFEYFVTKDELNLSNKTRFETYIEELLNKRIPLIKEGNRNASYIGKMKNVIIDIIRTVNKMKYNGQGGYGFGNLEYTENNPPLKENINYFTCIPYEYNDSPVDGSKFTDIEITIAATIQGYLKMIEIKNFRSHDLFLMIELYKNKNNIFTLDDIKLGRIYMPTFYKIFESKIEEMEALFKNTDNYFKFLEEILNNEVIKQKIKEKQKEIVYEYMVLIILPNYFKVERSHKNISFIDILGMIHTKVMFTGTPDFLIPHQEMMKMIGVAKNNYNIPLNQLLAKINMVNNKKNRTLELSYKVCNQIIEDLYSKGSIEAAIKGKLSIEKPKIFTNDIKEQNNEIRFFNFLFDKDNLKNYNTIIDVAGLILYTPVIEVVKMIFEYFGKNKKIIYMEDGVRKIYLGENNIIEYKGQICKTEEYFVYYDNKHTVGIDIKQPIVMKGLLTLADNTTLVQAAQGLFRLRKINMTHFIDFYLDFDIMCKNFTRRENNEITINSRGEVNMSLDKIFKFLSKNGEDYKNNTENSMQIQCLKYMVRELTKSKKWYNEIVDVEFEIKRNENRFTTTLENEFKRISGFTDLYISKEGEKSLNISREREQEREKEKEKEKEEEKEEKKERERERQRNRPEPKINHKLTPKIYVLCKFQDIFKGKIAYNLNLEGAGSSIPNLQILNIGLYFSIEIQSFLFSKDQINSSLYPNNCYLLILNQNPENERSKIHILITYNEYINILTRYNLYKKYYLNNRTRINTNSRNQNPNNLAFMIKKNLGNLNATQLNENFSKLKIYDNKGKCVFYHNQDGIHNRNYNINLNSNVVNNGLTTPLNNYKLLYLLVFYYKFNLPDTYKLLNYLKVNERNSDFFKNISVLSDYLYEDKSKVYDFEKIENLNELDNDSKLLDFFNFTRYKNENANNRNKTLLRGLLLEYIKGSITKEVFKARIFEYYNR